LLQSEVLDKFVRDTAWLFGASAHEVGAALAVLPERETMAAVSRQIQHSSISELQRAMTAAAQR
jgi:hypothetical protein